MIAPPVPTVHQTHVATLLVYQQPAEAGDGKVRFRDGCPRRGRARVCHVRITGDAPQDLRIKVWRKPDGSYMLAARDWR